MRFLDQTPTTSLFFSYNSPQCLEVIGSIPMPHFSFLFIFDSPWLPRCRGFDSHASHIFSSHFSLILTKRLWFESHNSDCFFSYVIFKPKTIVRIPFTTFLFTSLFSLFLTWWDHRLNPQWPHFFIFIFHNILNQLNMTKIYQLRLEIFVEFYQHLFKKSYTLVLRET